MSTIGFGVENKRLARAKIANQLLMPGWGNHSGSFVFEIFERTSWLFLLLFVAPNC